MLAGCMYLTCDIERNGTRTVEMYHLMKERGLKPPLISLDEGFKRTIWRPSTGITHDITHDTTHDAAETYREIAELEHWLVLVIPNEMNRLLIHQSALKPVSEEFTKSISGEITGEASVYVTDHVTREVTGEATGEATGQVTGQATGQAEDIDFEEVNENATPQATPQADEEVSETVKRVVLVLEDDLKRVEIQKCNW